MPSKTMHETPKIGGAWPLLGACLILSMLSIWLIFAGIAYQTYQSAWRDADLFATDVTLLLEQGIARDIEVYDLSLKALAKNASDADIMKLPLDIRRVALFDEATNAPGMGAMIVTDKGGNVIIESKRKAPPALNLADRSYFIAQRDGTATFQPYVSHPITSRVTQINSIILSRPKLLATGAFDGVVCGTIRVEYLTSLFASVPLPVGSTIALVHSDGTILARTPEMGVDVGAGVKAPTLLQAIQNGRSEPIVSTSVIDGIERLVAYHQVGSLPVYLAVGLSTQEFLGRWHWRVELVGFAFLGLSAIILFLGIMLARELSRRTIAERTLSELAGTDGLTLIANRRRFDEMLQREWRRAAREETPLSLLMIDGDYFKAFNDTYGHVEGDQALRLIAEALVRSIERPGDLVARFGGEEFVVLLPNTEQDGAYALAQTIKLAVRDLAVPHQGSPLGVLTVSIGVASLRPHANGAIASLIEAADAALYDAKAEGRDRIVLDSGLPAAPRPCRMTFQKTTCMPADLTNRFDGAFGRPSVDCFARTGSLGFDPFGPAKCSFPSSLSSSAISADRSHPA